VQGSYPPATKCAHGFATGSILVIGAPFWLIFGTTSPLSLDFVGYIGDTKLEFGAPSEALPWREEERVMNKDEADCGLWAAEVDASSEYD